MFDIAWSELMLIGAVALVVIGPKDLPKALRTVGQTVSKVRRMASEFQGQFNDAMREAELHDLKKQVEDVGGSVTSAMNTDFKPIEMPKDDQPASVGLDDAALKEAEAKLADLPLPEPLPPVEIAPAEVATPVVEDKPKRRRKVAAVEAEVVEPVAVAPEPVADVEPTAPAKTPRKRKAKVAEPDDGSAA
jgi:sec-independent protein translocase protein TatB